MPQMSCDYRKFAARQHLTSIASHPNLLCTRVHGVVYLPLINAAAHVHVVADDRGVGRSGEIGQVPAQGPRIRDRVEYLHLILGFIVPETAKKVQLVVDDLGAVVVAHKFAGGVVVAPLARSEVVRVGRTGVILTLLGFASHVEISPNDAS